MGEDEGAIIPTTTSFEEVLIQTVHNFRAPIASIYGYAGVIQHDIEYAKESAEEIQKIAERLQTELRLVEEYLRVVKQGKNTERPILVALPDELRDAMTQHLIQQGASVVEAISLNTALEIVQITSLRGIIVVSEWMVGEQVDVSDLLERIREKGIPAIILVSGDDFSRFFKQYDKRGYSPLEDYITIPVATEELRIRMRKTGMIEIQK